MLHLVCPDGELERYSPSAFLRSEAWSAVSHQAAALLPPVLLFHGAADATVPPAQSTDFAQALRDAGALQSVEVDVRPGLTHAEVIIEGPMRGEDYQIQLFIRFLFDEDRGRELMDS